MASSYTLSFKDKTTRKRVFKYHIVVGFGVLPLMPVMVALIMDTVWHDSPFAPDYGGIGKNFRIAWFSNRLGLLVFYILPVALMLAINIVFFSITICGILKTDASINNHIGDKVDNDGDNEDERKTLKRNLSQRTDALIKKSLKTKSKMLLFMKLLILMGLGWMLSFMASFIDQTWIYLVDTIANAFQGFFIAVTFIFNKKVLKLLKTKWN